MSQNRTHIGTAALPVRESLDLSHGVRAAAVFVAVAWKRHGLELEKGSAVCHLGTASGWYQVEPERGFDVLGVCVACSRHSMVEGSLPWRQILLHP